MTPTPYLKELLLGSLSSLTTKMVLDHKLRLNTSREIRNLYILQAIDGQNFQGSIFTSL